MSPVAARTGTRQRMRADQGETLVELVVSIALLGIAGVAVMSGLWVSVVSSTVGRNEATSSAYVRSWAESIQTHVDASKALGSCASYEALFDPHAATDRGLVNVSVKAVCTAVVGGLQQVQLSLTSGGDARHDGTEKLTVFIRQPCNGAAAVEGDNPCA